MTSQLIDLAQILQDISNLVIKGSFIIKQISQKMNKVYFKDQMYDPVTEADYLVQYTLQTYLQKIYKGIKIIGQENLITDQLFCKQFKKTAQNLNSMKINSQKLVKNYPYKKNQTFIQKSKICLWIDPLDCTRGFVSNKKEEVTILVGVSQDNKPIAGVIAQPYKIGKQNKSEFDPRVFIGSVYFNNPNEPKCCYQYYFLNKTWKKWQQYQHQSDYIVQRKVAISSRRLSERQNILIQKMNLQKIPMGGAGNKIVMLIRKQIGNLMFIDTKTSKWDSCAGQAIIRSMGGHSIKPNLENIYYCPQSQYINHEGFIICLNPNIFQQIKLKISQNQFQNNMKVLQKQIGIQ